MGLTSSLLIGRSALTASQVAIQIAGNNMANAATPGYTRQVAELRPTRGQPIGRGIRIGRGVQLADVRRNIDDALQSRVFAGVSDEASANESLNVFSSLESILGELTDQDLSSEISEFFSAWSEMANLTASSALVVQQGQKIAQRIQGLGQDLTNLRQQVETQISSAVSRADTLLDAIAGLNGDIANAELGNTTASSLRDQRDGLITQLSELIDVTPVEQASGAVNILVGSTPIVLENRSRGLTVRRQSQGDRVQVDVAVNINKQILKIGGGQVGALLSARESTIDQTLNELDAISSELIFQVNKLHSTGTTVDGLSLSVGTLSVPSDDQILALNHPTNQTIASLPFQPVNGGFVVNVRQSATGTTQSVRLDVDLDGIDNAGVAGFGDDTTLAYLVTGLNAIAGISAKINNEGKVQIDAEAGFDFSFSDDSSGVLAVLGVNSYFTGKSASDIAVNSELERTPSSLLTGRLDNEGVFVENGTALAITAMQDTKFLSLNNETISSTWTNQVQRVGVKTASASTRAAAAQVVRSSLESQRAAVSGVSIDEESINLLNFQRQYQAAARLITVADELTQTLLSIV